MELYYISSNNQKIDFMSFPYLANDNDLLDFVWEYSSSSSVRKNGGKITDFTRGVTEKSLSIDVSASDRASYTEALNYLTEVTEQDILSKTPGKLYFNEQYLSCYINASQSGEWDDTRQIMEKTLGIVSEYPFWVTETVRSFRSSGMQGTKRYAYSYPYTYGGVGKQNLTLINPHYALTDFKMVIYGPAVNPSVSIANHPYQVNITIEKGELLEIDSTKGTVYQITSKGQKISRFNERQKEPSVFEKIPPGGSLISWNGDFDLDVILYEERSEPRWSL